MDFKYFNLPRFRKRNHSLKHTENNYPARRKFVKTMGLGAIAWSPIVESVKTLHQPKVRFVQQKKVLKVWMDDYLAWEISPRVFEEGYSLNLNKIKNTYQLSIENLRYKNTQFIFSIKARIGADNKWEWSVSIPELDFKANGNFIDWLQKTQSLCANGNVDKRIATSNSSFIQASGAFKITLNPDWEFRFFAQNQVLFQKEQQQFHTNSG